MIKHSLDNVSGHGQDVSGASHSTPYAVAVACLKQYRAMSLRVAQRKLTQMPTQQHNEYEQFMCVLIMTS